MKSLFSKLGNLLHLRSWLIITLVMIITVVMSFGASKLEVKTSMDMMVSPETDFYQNTIRYQDEFGGELILLLLSGNKEQLFNSQNLANMNKVQSDIEKLENIRSVISPVTFADMTASQIKSQQNEFEDQTAASIQQAMEQAAETAKSNGATLEQQQQAAEQAKDMVNQKIYEEYRAEIQKMQELQQLGEFSATNDKFVRSVLFDKNGNPQELAKQILPENGNHALFIINLDGDLTVQQMSAATSDIEEVLKKHPFAGLSTTMSGTPAVTKALEDNIATDMGLMLALSVVLMVIVLWMVFPARWRLISLPVILIGMVWTFGLMGYLGVPISLVTMAILPILIGLGTDFSIQFHNRYEEEIKKTQDRKTALITTVRQMGPAVGIAVVIMALGFSALLTSAAPMIKDFGLMLAVGVFILYAMSLLLLIPILNLRDKKKIKIKSTEKVSFVERGLGKLASGIVKRPLAILMIPVILSGFGFALDHKLGMESNVEKLMPQDAPALVDLNKIRNIVGSTINFQLLIEADDVTDPEVIKWTYELERDLAQYDHVTQVTGISSVLATMNNEKLPEDTGAALNKLPDLMQQMFVSKDKKMSVVTITIDSINTAEQEKLLDQMVKGIDAPAGVKVNPVGLQVLQIKALNGLTDNRHTSMLIGLAAILVGLTLTYRKIKQALLPIIPIVMVIGWSSGILYLLGTDINPLTAVLGALVLGIGTEFTILFMERYHEEKANGLETKEAVMISMTKVGRAITASGLTVVAGFSTLIFSNFAGLSAFGISTVVDTFLCLLSTVIILPALIVLLDKDKKKLQ